MAKSKTENTALTGNIKPSNWVQKSDPLLLMRSVPFTLGELKILDTYISRINAADDTRRTVIFTKEEYEELMGISKINADALKKHTEGMLGKVVTLEMPNHEYLQFVLFTRAHYRLDDYGKPVVELTCTEDAKDLFFCIGKYHYFKYALENIIKLNRKASYLLYVHIVHNRYRGEWTVDLGELRDIVLDCKEQESYQEYKIFKRDVLDPAVKEINEKTDCKCRYEVIKRGRRVAAIRFEYMGLDELGTDGEFKGQTNLLDEIDRKAEYGSEYFANLAAETEFEFNKAQIERIADILTRIDIPKDRHTDSLEWGRCNYLHTMYLKLNTAAQRTKSPIKNRYNYFVKMLEKEEHKY